MTLGGFNRSRDKGTETLSGAESTAHPTTWDCRKPCLPFRAGGSQVHREAQQLPQFNQLFTIHPTMSVLGDGTARANTFPLKTAGPIRAVRLRSSPLADVG